MQIVFLLLSFLAIIDNCIGEAPPMGKVTMEELRMQYYPKDSSARAVILNDYGELDCSGYTCRFTTYQKIKIFNKEFSDLATHTFKVYKDTYLAELTGTCYILKNNKVVSFPLTQDLIHKIKEKDYEYVKFSIPNIEDGCIIEFKYTLNSTTVIRLPYWQFQSFIPVKKSELVFRSVTVNFGYELLSSFPLQANEAERENGNYRWLIQDLPAFKGEEFVINKRDYVAQLTFFVNPPPSIDEGWKELVKGVKNKQSFVKPDIGFLKPHLESIQKQSTDSLSLLEGCYNFIASNVRLIESDNTIDCRSLKKVFESKSGSATEINFLLCCLLTEAGFRSEPVLLSTREHGRISNTVYPSKYNFNYLVAFTSCKGKTYYLDATNELRPYLYPSYHVLDCDGIFLQQKDVKWTTIKPSSSYSDNWTFDLKIDSLGVIKGRGILVKKGYSAIEARESVKSLGKEGFLKQFRKQWLFGEMKNVRLENENEIAKNLTFYFSVQFEDTLDLKANKLLLNPFLIKLYETNPLKLKERNYPLDFLYPVEHSFRLNLKIPESYKVHYISEDLAISNAERTVGYKYFHQVSATNSVTVYDNFNSKNCYYLPEGYKSIQELINKMIEKQKQDIVLIKND